MSKLFARSIVVLGSLVFVGALFFAGNVSQEATNFEECLAQGNPAMESYPRQCIDESGNHFTENITLQMTREEAFEIAGNSKDCSATGIITHKKENMVYNAVTNTWWFGLERIPELEKDGCSPACVVNEDTRTALVNWRCTGLETPEEPTVFVCEDEQRNVGACIEIYQPVCAKVNIQCVTTPCDPVEETYSNSCFACQNPLVSDYVEGECLEI